MRQAVLLEIPDVLALRAGTPLTISVGGQELLIMLAPRERPAIPATRPAQARSKRTLAQIARIVKAHDACENGTKTTFLKRHKLSTSDIWRYKQRLAKAAKK